MKSRLDLILYYGPYRRAFRLLSDDMDEMHSILVPLTKDAKKHIAINFNVIGGKWHIADGDYECGDYGALKPGKSVTLSIQDMDNGQEGQKYSHIKVSPYLLDAAAARYTKYAIKVNCGEIAVGNQNSALSIKGWTDSTAASFLFEKENATVKPLSQVPVFVNGRHVTEKYSLQILDSIHIQEINLIYFGHFLAVSHVGDCVFCNDPDKLPVYKNNSALSSAHNRKTYDFQRSTQLRLGLVPETVALDVPPAPKTQRLSPFILQAGASLSMFVVMAASLTVRITMGGANQALAIVSMFAMVGSLSGMVVFPKLMRNYQMKKTEREEQERYEAYHAYLDVMRKKLAHHLAEDIQLLESKYPRPQWMIDIACGRKRELWGRAPVFKEFLDIRVGTGTRPSLHSAQIPDEGFVIKKDFCRQAADELVQKYQYTNNVPITVELMKHPIVGIFGNYGACVSLINAMILQIVALHSYDDVKLIFLYDPQDNEMHFTRWLPHLWNRDRNFRFIASSKQEVDGILEILQPIFDEREEKIEKQKSVEKEVFIPHFIIISLSPKLLRNEMLHRQFLSSYDDLNGMGISFIIYDKNLGGMPLLSNILINCLNPNEAYIYYNDGKSKEMQIFKPDRINETDWSDGFAWPSLSRHLFRTQTMDISENNLLPQSLSFMKMYNVKSLDDLDIRNRWLNNDCTRNISAPIGVSVSNIFNLDIHEKGHGPHGLVAGTTGSGKSEFIQSLILSLCVNYSPSDIAFIIIDYKGGSTVNIFKSLPHLAGSITNLGGSQIQRSLTSIKSELKRRQRIFESCGNASVNSIDKYNEFRKENPSLEPLPHLIIIADEFAELKIEQPDFMKEIISASRIGRSLGVHLLLATQKPAGVVNEQVLSNTRFRVCLKVAEKTDSQDMLKRPDAADITQPGRAYVQVGNNEIYSLIQTGYSGAPFHTEEQTGKEVAEVFYIQHNGQINLTDSAREETGKTEKTKPQLEVIVNYIHDAARDIGFKPYRIWLDPLPERLFWSDLTRYGNFPPCYENGSWKPYVHWMSPVVGILDDVEEQRQILLTLDFARNGHVVLYGAKNSGKTTFVQTLIYALAVQYSPEDVYIYLVDYDIGALGYCEQLPHVGGVITSGDGQRLKSLFILLAKEMEARKEMLSKDSFTDMKSYMEEKRVQVPAVLVIIHRFESFAAECDPYVEKVQAMIRDGAKYGIFFVLTGSTRASVPSGIQRYIKYFLCLQMIESVDYKLILGSQAGDVQPEAFSGRGVVRHGERIMEFHTAMAFDTKMDSQRVIELRKCYIAIKEAWDGKHAPVLAAIPNPYLLLPSLSGGAYQELLKVARLPIGYDTGDNTLLSLNVLDINVFPIIGGLRSGKSNMLRCLLRLCKEIPGVALYVFDSSESSIQLANECKLMDTYANFADKERMTLLINELKNEGLARGDLWKQNPSMPFSPIIIFIDDIVHFFIESGDLPVNIIDGLIQKATKYGFYFFVTGQKMDALKGRVLYNALFQYEQGILLGGNAEVYNYFNSPQMSYKLRTEQYPPGMGYWFTAGKYSIIKTPHYNNDTQ